MRFSLPLLSALCALLWFTPAAHAENAPPPAGPAVSQTPPPAPPSTPPSSQAPAPVAKKEEDEGASMMDRLRAAKAGMFNSDGIAGKVAALEKQVSTLTAQLAERDKTIAQLRADLQERTELLSTFDTWLQEQGHTTAKEAAADTAKAFETAVSTGVANTIRKIGVPVATIKAKSAPEAAASTLEDVEQQLAAAKSSAERQALLAKHKDVIFRSN